MKIYGIFENIVKVVNQTCKLLNAQLESTLCSVISVLITKL